MAYIYIYIYPSVILPHIPTKCNTKYHFFYLNFIDFQTKKSAVALFFCFIFFSMFWG